MIDARLPIIRRAQSVQTDRHMHTPDWHALLVCTFLYVTDNISSSIFEKKILVVPFKKNILLVYQHMFAVCFFFSFLRCRWPTLLTFYSICQLPCSRGLVRRIIVKHMPSHIRLLISDEFLFSVLSHSITTPFISKNM